MKKKSSLPHFHDFLGIAKSKLMNSSLIVFYGMSGSGKSANLCFLANHHQDFKNRSHQWIWTAQKKSKFSSVADEPLVVVDEITSVFQLFEVKKLVKKNSTVAVASHLHPFWFRFSMPRVTLKSFQTDNGDQKLRTYLNRKNISFNTKALNAYIKKYGANYLDLQCILERFPNRNLGEAIQASERLDCIKLKKPNQWIPNTPRLRYE